MASFFRICLCREYSFHMNLNREISLILLALSLLTILIAIWLRSVYYGEINALKTEANIEFIRALEQTEDELIFNTPALHGFTGRHKAIRELLPSPDSINFKHIEVIEVSTDESILVDSLFSKDLRRTSRWRPADSAKQMIVTINAGTSEITVGEGKSVKLDVDSVKQKLQVLYANRLDSSHLSGLRIRVIENGMDSNFRAGFITDPAGLSNIFFSDSEYIAAVDFGWIVILRRMIPEFIFAMFLFLAVAGAFYTIYKNLVRERNLALLKDDFVSNITHELKTPISIVHVAVEALSSFDGLDDRQKTAEYLEISKRELHRLDHMVDHILDISKENAQINYPLERIEVVEELKNLISNTGLDKDRIHLKSHPDTAFIKMNAELFKIVIHNLLDNSLKYDINQGNVHIALGSDEKWVNIEIRDHGPGIPQDQIKHVFDKFYRVPTSNIHNVKGHGLGLYYVKKHVEEANGKIIVENVQPGVKFILQIPRANAN